MKVIYILVDPRTPAEVRYVGYTSKGLSSRLRDHLTFALRHGRDSYCQRWIRSLCVDEVSPEIRHLERVIASTWAARECYWIKRLKDEGHRLTNCTGGGEGVVDELEEVRFRRIKSAVAAWQRPDVRAKHDAHMNPFNLPEVRARAVAACLGKPRSDETKEKNRGGRPGRPMDYETRMKISRTQKGRVF